MNILGKHPIVARPWKILIADDDLDVHATTKLALRDVVFRNRPLQFIDAYSASEALGCMQEHPDVAVAFLDVVMETDSAGLNVVRKIRESGFGMVRLIIRTGYPGQAPERDVIVNYDIHDYKEKSGLSAQKLFTSLISALRSYEDLVALEKHRRGLMAVLESVSWLDFGDVKHYLSGMLSVFSDLARLRSDRVLVAARMSSRKSRALHIVASYGDFGLADDQPQPVDALPPELALLLTESFVKAEGLSSEDGCTLFVSCHGIDLVAYAQGDDVFAEADGVLLEVFLINVCQALANYRAFRNIESERDGLLKGLASVAEQRNGSGMDTQGSLAKLCEAIAQRLNTLLEFPQEIDDAFLKTIGAASLLNDLGDLSLPADLLGKPAALNPIELSRMQAHVKSGLQILESCLQGDEPSGVSVMASQIIASHHERYDGGGYPAGLSGDAIPLAGRIVAVADAYVAMTSARPYHRAISPQQASAIITAESGRQFDPKVVRAFMEVLESGSVI